MTASSTFKKGARVLVTMRGGSGGHEVEQPGVVTEVAGHGAFVKLDRGGNSNWFNWKKMRIEQAPLRAVPRSGALATLGEAAKIKAPPHLEPKPSEPVKLGVDPPVAVGDIIYRERQARGIMQEAFARAIGVSAVQLSEIERGISKPKDEQLERLHEVFDISLDLLIDASARYSGGKRESSGERTQAPSEHSSDSVPLGSFEEFVETLAEIVPLPLDRDRRRLWMQAARQLHQAGVEH